MQGEERQALWDELKNFLGPPGQEGDEDDAVDGAADDLALARVDSK